MSERRVMDEEETQKGRKEAREKVVVEMEEIIEKGYGNVTFGSEGIRLGEHIERKKGELEKGTWWSRGENEEDGGGRSSIVKAFGGGKSGRRGKENAGQRQRQELGGRGRRISKQQW